MIAENMNRGALICKQFTGVRSDCGLRDDLLLVNRLLVTVSWWPGSVICKSLTGGVSKQSNEAVASCWHFLCWHINNQKWLRVERRHKRVVCRQMHIRRRNLSVCIAANMVEKKCHKCNYIAKTNWAWQQHLNRSTPCDAGTFECRLGCGKPLKSAETRCRHEKTCQGPQRTREEVEAGEEEAQAKLASTEEASKLDLAIISQASTSVVTKLVSGIQSNPEMVLDVN